jgi:hypothetical protein
MTLGVALGSFQALNVAVYAHYFGRSHALQQGKET